MAQKKTPIFNQDERKKMLEAVRYVDEVRIFDEIDPREALRQIKPYAHVKSKSGYKGLEKEILDEYGGKLILVDDIPSFSSTSLMYEIARRVIQYNWQDEKEIFMR
jgi:bifunctional ADP-heptose synthase (sugar kinase/adenylyltransferase)